MSYITILICQLSHHWTEDQANKVDKEMRVIITIKMFVIAVDYWQIAILESWHWGLVTDNQRVTWTAFAVFPIFLFGNWLGSPVLGPKQPAQFPEMVNNFTLLEVGAILKAHWEVFRALDFRNHQKSNRFQSSTRSLLRDLPQPSHYLMVTWW